MICNTIYQTKHFSLSCTPEHSSLYKKLVLELIRLHCKYRVNIVIDDITQNLSSIFDMEHAQRQRFGPVENK